ncbi:hypothetical protein K438DRAFT_1996771 [Mycena galopus ATCC 62051]|nr:hypothetical protein K438DRAFT_1996771 [Mycena galopus ATCC 62051]
MPPGRKSLDPETKQDHRRVSSAIYEAKNADKRREAAKLRMQRLRAAVANSDYHTRRKYRAQAAAHSEQYCNRKQEADAMRTSHCAAPTASSTQGPTPPLKRMPRARPLHTSSSHRPPVGNSQGSEDEVDGEESDTPRLDDTFFPGRITPRTAVGRPCPGCGLYDCPSCACMCTESTEWVDHPGGHFFPDCKKCGGTECPVVRVSASTHWTGSSTVGM